MTPKLKLIRERAEDWAGFSDERGMFALDWLTMYSALERARDALEFYAAGHDPNSRYFREMDGEKVVTPGQLQPINELREDGSVNRVTGIYSNVSLRMGRIARPILTELDMLVKVSGK